MGGRWDTWAVSRVRRSAGEDWCYGLRHDGPHGESVSDSLGGDLTYPVVGPVSRSGRDPRGDVLPRTRTVCVLHQPPVSRCAV